MSQTKSKGSFKQARKRTSFWPIVFAVGGLGLLILAAGSFFRSRSGSNTVIEVNGSPKLKVDKEHVDLGDVRLGEWVTVSFDLTNVGDQPLRFQDTPYIEVVAGC